MTFGKSFKCFALYCRGKCNLIARGLRGCGIGIMLVQVEIGEMMGPPILTMCMNKSVWFFVRVARDAFFQSVNISDMYAFKALSRSITISNSLVTASPCVPVSFLFFMVSPCTAFHCYCSFMHSLCLVSLLFTISIMALVYGIRELLSGNMKSILNY